MLGLTASRPDSARYWPAHAGLVGKADGQNGLQRCEHERTATAPGYLGTWVPR